MLYHGINCDDWKFIELVNEEELAEKKRGGKYNLNANYGDPRTIRACYTVFQPFIVWRGKKKVFQPGGDQDAPSSQPAERCEGRNISKDLKTESLVETERHIKLLYIFF